jgi:GntR family histidine utilization transcriptional repressor
MLIERDDAQPLYQRIKDHIKERIESGLDEPGGRIASEHELVRTHGASRMTVNRAVRELTAEGWLERVQGLGTFVSAPTPQLPLVEVRSIAEEIAARGSQHSSTVMRSGSKIASTEIAHKLGLVPGEDVFHVLVVHYENGAPIQIEDRYVNPVVAPSFLSQDFSAIPPGEYLLKHVPYTEMEHVIEATSPDAEACRLLKIGKDEPCLVLHRRTWVQDDVVTSVRLTHPGDSFSIGSRFKPIKRGAVQAG